MGPASIGEGNPVEPTAEPLVMKAAKQGVGNIKAADNNARDQVWLTVDTIVRKLRCKDNGPDSRTDIELSDSSIPSVAPVDDGDIQREGRSP
jgi:hypothetical protein